jgi:hypothetical protein
MLNYVDLKCYICKVNRFDALCNIIFREHFPEDGQNSWPKHAAGYAVYNIINLYIYMYLHWLVVFLIMITQVSHPF